MVVGTVQSVKPYGAFVDIGGVNGLLHISQISEDRVTNVEAVLSEGDKLKVGQFASCICNLRQLMGVLRLAPRQPSDGMLRGVHLHVGDVTACCLPHAVASNGVLCDAWGGCCAQVMVLSQDRDKGRVALSTRKLERTKGDMLRDPQKARCHESVFGQHFAPALMLRCLLGHWATSPMHLSCCATRRRRASAGGPSCHTLSCNLPPGNESCVSHAQCVI